MADFDASKRWMIEDSDEPPEPGYEEWKRAKILLALEQAKDRSKMIPIEEIWKRFGFES